MKTAMTDEKLCYSKPKEMFYHFKGFFHDKWISNGECICRPLIVNKPKYLGKDYVTQNLISNHFQRYLVDTDKAVLTVSII